MKTHRSQPATGFSLLELMLVIAILGVLTAMSVSVMARANEDAKSAATQSRISKIESMLRLQLEQYEIRRLPIRRAALQTYISGTDTLVQLRNLRYRILVDILNTEMPRPFLTNPGYNPQTETPVYTSNSCGNGTAQLVLGVYPIDTFPNFPGSPSLNDALATQKPAAVYRWQTLANKHAALGVFDLPAEYLYEILRGIDMDGVNGLESLGNNAIGDSDIDGVPEIVDSWGEPLDFQLQQLEATEVTAGSGKWEDTVPSVYIDLDSTIPRSMDKIRFQVISRKTEENF